jgi:hypothetical protein
LSRGTLDEKLEWTFQLYDVNGDGFISRDEMTEVMTSVYELMGKVSEGCKEENQIKAKVENMFKVNRKAFKVHPFNLISIDLGCLLYVFFLPSKKEEEENFYFHPST